MIYYFYISLLFIFISIFSSFNYNYVSIYSHLLSIPSGVLPLDAINGSPIMLNNFHMSGGMGGLDTGAAGGGAGAGGGGFEEFGMCSICICVFINVES